MAKVLACITTVQVQRMPSLNDATMPLLFACLDRLGLEFQRVQHLSVNLVLFRRESADLNSDAIHVS
jgi:hypothetical protein